MMSLSVHIVPIRTTPPWVGARQGEQEIWPVEESEGTTLFPILAGLFPVEHRFMDVDGAGVHYVDEGAGSVLLLLHGNPSWSFLYRKIIASLKSDFRCVALDYPGYGMSTAPGGYGFTPRENSATLERLIASDLRI